MIVYTTGGKQVSIVDDIKGALVDSEGRRWARDAHHDTPEHAARVLDLGVDYITTNILE